MENEIKDIDIMKAIQKYNYLVYCKYRYDVINRNDDIEFLSISKFLNSISSYDYNRCSKLLHNRYKRKSRIYKCIDWMLLNGKVCYFCTFTLSDDHVNRPMTYLRQVLTQNLMLLNTWYLGNVDYGDTTGRLHFHVIIMENEIHINKDSLKWPFGFYDIKVINIKDSVSERLGSYIFKLTNHATKETTKNRIITPRGQYSFTKILSKMS